MKHEQRPSEAISREEGLLVRARQGGHLIVRLGNRRTVLPMHGGSKELSKGLWNAILKDLRLTER